MPHADALLSVAACYIAGRGDVWVLFQYVNLTLPLESLILSPSTGEMKSDELQHDKYERGKFS